MTMTQRASIDTLLAALIIQGNVPMKAVEIAGEIIAIAARLSDYDLGRKHRAKLESWSKSAEVYETMLRRAQSAIAEFNLSHDGSALLESLSSIKHDLVALELSP